jgi:hypothetical protein
MNIKGLHSGTCRVGVGLPGKPILSTVELEVKPGLEQLRYHASATVDRALWGTGPADLFLVGGSGGPLISHYDGKAWTIQLQADNFSGKGGLGPLRDVWGSGAADVIAVGHPDQGYGDVGYVAQYDGSKWAESYRAAHGLTAVWGSGPDAVFAVGKYGAVAKRSGASWSPVETGLTVSFLDIWGTSAQNLYAVAVEVIGGSIDAGIPKIDVKMVDAGKVDAGKVDAGKLDGGKLDGGKLDAGIQTSRGVIVHYDGQSWHREAEGLLKTLAVASCSGVWASGPDDVYAMCGTTCLHFSKGVWSEAKDLAGRQMWGTGPSELFYVDAKSQPQRWDGAQVTAFPQLSSAWFVWGQGTNAYFIGTEGVFRWGGL